MPTPPNNIKNIHPKNDIIAIIYTAKEVVNVIVVSFEVFINYYLQY
jgi:hypothetical protein